MRFEDIRIENFRQGQLVNLRIFFNEKYCKAPGRGIENVVFKNFVFFLMRNIARHREEGLKMWCSKMCRTPVIGLSFP